MPNFDRPLPILHCKQWQNPTSHLHSIHSINSGGAIPIIASCKLVLKVKTAPFVYCTQPKDHINKVLYSVNRTVCVLWCLCDTAVEEENIVWRVEGTRQLPGLVVSPGCPEVVSPLLKTQDLPSLTHCRTNIM